MKKSTLWFGTGVLVILLDLCPPYNFWSVASMLCIMAAFSLARDYRDIDE